MVPNVGSNRLSRFGHTHRGDLGALYGPVRSLNQHHDLCVIALRIVADNTGSKYPRFGSKKQNNLDLGPTSGPAATSNDGVRWGARLTTVHRQFFGLGRSTAAQMPLVSCFSMYAISRGIG